MTIENYNYRTSQIMLRNQFPGKDKFQIPVIPKFEAKPDDFNNLLLIGFDKITADREKHCDRMVHFFLYDYRFERVWEKPENDIEKLSKYRAVLSPDFSMYIEMAPVMQLYNVFRNRWCGAYWAHKGIRVVPTVNWGDEATFDFCFKGIEKGSTVAVSTYMASEHGNRQDQKEWFMAGYNEMLRQIEPERMICYNTPFPEMEGNIVYVDYELSSWKYMSYENTDSKENLECFKTPDAFAKNYDIMSAYMISAGGGSAFGGNWKPAKSGDERFIGEPGEIKRTIDRNGNIRDTKIGQDGRAIKERHYTDHGNPKNHSVPHDHTITWERNHPGWGKVENYRDGNYPEFKLYWRYSMDNNIQKYCDALDDISFKSIAEFKWCIECGAEIELEWKGIHFGIIRYGSDDRITAYLWNQPDTEQGFDSADDALEYMVGTDRLRDIITQVNVIDRTI